MKKTFVVNIIMTVYFAVASQTDSTPTITSTMLDLEDARDFDVIALSRDLLETFPYHSYVHVNCGGCRLEGPYRVEDTMNKRYTNRVDILIDENDPIGKWYNVTISKID